MFGMRQTQPCQSEPIIPSWFVACRQMAVCETAKENTMSENTESPRERLVDDLANVLGEAEEMLSRAAAETGEKARDLRSQVETKLLRAKLRLQEIEGEAVDRAKAAARATDDYVHDHPWQAIGVAAAIGLAVGLLLNRRS